MSLFGPKKAAPGIDERLTVLEGKVRDLKTANKHLELEWEELYDKVRRQMSRMSKRSAIDAPPLVPDEPVVIAPDDGLDEISRGILALRNAPRKIA